MSNRSVNERRRKLFSQQLMPVDSGKTVIESNSNYSSTAAKCQLVLDALPSPFFLSTCRLWRHPTLPISILPQPQLAKPAKKIKK